MSIAEREAKVREIILSVMEIEESELTRTTRFKDLGADSLDAIQVVTDLEEAFDVEIDPKAGSRMVNIEAILELLAECEAK
ncbi:acyl carrier protein [Streptomyces bobili]|uniref:acyl carrier protein n=1 Tax=Streptomyces bobili TaxID=67280 RepID=UPI003664B731